MPASQFIQLNTTDKYVNSDNIAGSNYAKYESVLYYFLTKQLSKDKKPKIKSITKSMFVQINTISNRDFLNCRCR